MRLLKNNGVLITVVIITLLVLTLLAGYVMSLAFHQKKMVDQVSGSRLQRYYAAQAGVVDAQWRIRNDSTAEIGGGSFSTSSFSPTYYINLSNDSVHAACGAGDSVRVVIGALDGAIPGFRKIESTGIESC
jgi:Tfp pilus assembly protein PilX